MLNGTEFLSSHVLCTFLYLQLGFKVVRFPPNGLLIIIQYADTRFKILVSFHTSSSPTRNYAPNNFLVFPYIISPVSERSKCCAVSVFFFGLPGSLRHNCFIPYYVLVYISIVKPTRCTNVLNLFYFGTTLCMFRTVSPSIIRNLRLYI